MVMVDRSALYKGSGQGGPRASIQRRSQQNTPHGLRFRAAAKAPIASSISSDKVGMPATVERLEYAPNSTHLLRW